MYLSIPRYPPVPIRYTATSEYWRGILRFFARYIFGICSGLIFAFRRVVIRV